MAADSVRVSKVQFDNIKRHASRPWPSSMLDDLQPLFEEQLADTVDRLETGLAGDNPQLRLDGFTLNFADDMQRAFAKLALTHAGRS